MAIQVTALSTNGCPGLRLGLRSIAFMNTLTFALPLAGPISPLFSQARPSQRCQSTDQGVTVVVQVLDSSGDPVNIRAASARHILTMRPSGIAMPVPAALYTNGLDGKMSFDSAAVVPYGTGLSEVGVWQVQGKVVIGGNTQYTSIGAFQVNANLGA